MRPQEEKKVNLIFYKRNQSSFKNQSRINHRNKLTLHGNNLKQVHGPKKTSNFGKHLPEIVKLIEITLEIFN